MRKKDTLIEKRRCCLPIKSVSINDQPTFGIMGKGNIVPIQCWRELSLNVSGTMISSHEMNPSVLYILLSSTLI
jgi:hypothetical protein